ncbi:hypothetical protein EV421DRAFT_1857430 [Armillaria borealis]|uniref:Nephrocystin 3-like N-terminal domain-containing protein n=1 Tax=Armillaria borealis TaxID=47425 RepID=A0AA39IUC1_9AGAR|nr:hypothetical protein EV421DRAFT_1857430 [Armillaria borealis]
MVPMAEDAGVWFIKDVELQWLLFTDVTRIYLIVAAGDVAHKTKTVEYQAYLPSESKTIWSPQLNLGHLDASTTVALKLYSSRKFLFPRLLGTAKVSVADIFAPNKKDEPLLLGRASPPLPTVSLKIVYSSDRQEVIKGLVNNVSKPEMPLNKYSSILDVLGDIKGIIDLVTEANPIAKMAWVVITMGVDILRKQNDTDKLIVELYETMLAAYAQATGEKFLNRIVEFGPIYNSLVDQTIVCAKFIEIYANKGLIGRIVNGNLAEEAKRIQQKFHEIYDKLLLALAEDNHELLTAQSRKTQIKETQDNLKPSSILKPKNPCLDGTRDQILKDMMNWIERCNGYSLWCTGMAGTGKSSLMSTLRSRLASTDAGRSRLGCYIRYDRKVYTDLSQLVNTIAYSLCTFDNRIATAISEAERTQASSLPSSGPQDKFRILLQEPLATVQLNKQSPIVIIVDGLDECDVTEDILLVLAEGFGPNLPFMRLIVSCRPIDCVTRILAGAQPDTLVNISLEDVSYRDQVVCDIQLYIQDRFSTIYKRRRLQDGTDEFRNVCESLQAADKLSRRAEGLFIWAATACDFLNDYPVISRLKQLLEMDAPKNALDAMTSLYRTALRAIVSENPQDTDIVSAIRAVLGALIVATDEITVQTLDDLVLPRDRSAQLILAKLGSVVHTSQQGYIQLIHQSFYDFLKDRNQCEEQWYVDEEEQRRQLLHSIDNLKSSERRNYLPLHKTLSDKVH